MELLWPKSVLHVENSKRYPIALFSAAHAAKNPGRDAGGHAHPRRHPTGHPYIDQPAPGTKAHHTTHNENAGGNPARHSGQTLATNARGQEPWQGRWRARSRQRAPCLAPIHIEAQAHYTKAHTNIRGAFNVNTRQVTRHDKSSPHSAQPKRGSAPPAHCLLCPPPPPPPPPPP